MKHHHARRGEARASFATLRTRRRWLAVGAGAGIAAAVAACGGSDAPPVDQAQLAAEGKQIFRSDTFGDEAMHWAVLRHVLGESPVVPKAFMA